MGFFAPEDVQDTFVVEDASEFSPNFPFSQESAPEPDVSFRGTAVTIHIDDIIAANGSRDPSVSESQKEFRHLFVLIVKKENPFTQEELNSADLLRTSWESFFSRSTEGIASVDTSVR
jgi:hypothetical protein